MADKFSRFNHHLEKKYFGVDTAHTQTHTALLASQDPTQASVISL